jgi:uncharacterized protein DUF2017
VGGRIRRHRGGRVTVELEPFEVILLHRLAEELLELLDDGSDPGGEGGQGGRPDTAVDPLESLLDVGPSVPPEDPVLARLLPDGYRDDPEAAAEFRRFTEPDLRNGKRANARVLLATLARATGDPDGAETVQLDQQQARAWLYALTDLRLALGSRLEIEEDYDRQMDALDEDDGRRPLFAIYEWLTAVQDTLVRALR